MDRQLALIFGRMRITKKPLLDIYLKSYYGELEQANNFLIGALGSYNKIVDSFLRDSSQKQLQALMDIDCREASSSLLLNCLREHEYVVVAFC